MNQETLEQSHEKAEIRDFIKKTGRELGLTKKRRQYEITRTALTAYKELHGMEYKLPEGVVILEDQ